MNNVFTLSNSRGGKVFLPIECVLKVATDTLNVVVSDLHNSKLKEKQDNKLLIPNDEEFECPVCFIPIEVGDGVKLRNCFHYCCKYVYENHQIACIQFFCFRDCLHDHIMVYREADIPCPWNEGYDCKALITEQEMQAVHT